MRPALSFKALLLSGHSDIIVIHSAWTPSPCSTRRPTMNEAETPDYLPARMLNEFVYCPRLFYYEWVEGVFAHSVDTVAGSFRHQKLERKDDALKPAEEAEARERIHSRSVTLSSEQHKLIAKMDLIEGEGKHV